MEITFRFIGHEQEHDTPQINKAAFYKKCPLQRAKRGMNCELNDSARSFICYKKVYIQYSDAGLATTKMWEALRRAFVLRGFVPPSRYVMADLYLELVYLVTAFVPSDTACLASSPGRSRRTAVWISRELMVDRLL